MESLIESTKDQLVLILIVIFTGTGIVIKKLYSYFLRYVDTKVKIIVDTLKRQAKEKKLIFEKELQAKLNINILRDGNRLNSILKSIQEELNAKSVQIRILHNGVAKGFKNYSVRFEQARRVELGTMDKLQNIPLSHYYDILTNFEDQDFIVLDKNHIDYTDYKDKTIKKKVIFPILDKFKGSTYRNSILVIERDKTDYILIGLLIVILDDKSEEFKDEEIFNIVSVKLHQIQELYNEDRLVFS